MKEFIKFVSIIFIAVVVLTKGTIMIDAQEKKDIKLCIEGESLPVKIQLYRNGEKLGKAVDLRGVSKYTWEDIELEDENGEDYKFTVKAVGDEYGWIEVDGRVFTTTYKGNLETGFKIESEEQVKTVPTEPELAIAEENRIIEFK